MTQEEKNLLLQDLCARLAYGVVLQCVDPKFSGSVDWKLIKIDIEENIVITTNEVWTDEYLIENVKPYLRPMSSMTEEEIYEYNKLVELNRSDKESFNNLRIEYVQNHPEYKNMPCVPMYRHIDYLNTHHLDYRGLIPMDLALSAPEGMY